MRLPILLTLMLSSNIVLAEDFKVPFHDVAARPGAKLYIKYNLTKHQTMTCGVDGAPIQIYWNYKGANRAATRRDPMTFTAKNVKRAEPIDAKGTIILINYTVDGKIHLASCRYS